MSRPAPQTTQEPVATPAHKSQCALRGRSRFHYVPALDGLRGFAVLAVMIYHAAPEILPGGFLGVELFFVLSGFLITSVLLQEHDRSGIQLGRFYIRRLLRLAPALIVMLSGVVLFCRIGFSNETFQSTVSDAACSLGYVFNWVRASDPGRASFLGHTWSLCIEEQFYLLWPLLLLAFIALGRRDRLTERLLGAVAVVFLWRVVLSTSASPMRLYNGLDTRADGLLLGCALGAAIHDGRLRFESPVTKRWLTAAMPFCAATLATLCLIVQWFEDSTYLCWLSVTGLLSATLICGVMANAQKPGKLPLLESQPAMILGKLSYGVYLWHYPVYRMMNAAGWTRMEVALAGTVLALALATASWFLVEKPVLRLKDRFAADAPRIGVRRAASAKPATS